MEAAENDYQEINCLHKNRIEICLACISLFVILFWLFCGGLETVKIVKMLRIIVIIQINNVNVMPIIFIVKSENVYSFFKCHLVKVFNI